jgi:hypothetical protein
MKIELKNFKFYDRLSEETLCFVGNIWVNGVKCGYAENTGKGGCTSYHHEGTAKSRELMADAEGFCESNGTTLYDYIDDLSLALVKKKEDESLAKKLNKEMQKAILIGTDSQYQVISFKKPLREVWETQPDYFKKVLIEKLDKYKVKGYRLLNTNIPQQFLTN